MNQCAECGGSYVWLSVQPGLEGLCRQCCLAEAKSRPGYIAPVVSMSMKRLDRPIRMKALAVVDELIENETI